VEQGRVPAVLVDGGAADAVKLAAAGLRSDLSSLAGPNHRTAERMAIIIGTLGDKGTIDSLVRAGKLDASAVQHRWEGFLQKVVERPRPGIDRALVIAGADRRGAIFGTYDVSRRAGVSPWAWWADVPVGVRERLVVSPGMRVEAPAVKYRGIFLNDEDPSLSGWATAKFGGVNHRFYAREFELVLRLKGNLIWPAMWGKSLWQDDPESAKLADAMGVVVGTSHHEPMLRAHVEWQRAKLGAWDYRTNARALRNFWREGLKRDAGREALVTIGMRGDGDEPMTQGTAIPLLEHIVADQRQIIADVSGRAAAKTPQVWALYKEVQDYYDQGMQVPDDVTLLFSDDNWGNLRRLPDAGAHRAGGYGIYYHFDYVGGPRNYKWLNVTQIGRVWEQMSLARARGADRLWMANVGDLKPMELPISFFLDYAWNPEGWGPDAGRTYLRQWAAEQFGPDQAEAVADILDRETRFTARRTPELTAAETWDVTTEWPRIMADYARLEADARRVGTALSPAMQDAYFELVLHPVLATATLNRLYYNVALNRAHALAGLPDIGALAERAGALFQTDRDLARRYEASAGGKWPHMMDQTHIGYQGWQQPDVDRLPMVAHAPGPVSAPPLARHSIPNAYVAVDAEHGATTSGSGATWTRVDGLGRTGTSMTVYPRPDQAFSTASGPALTFDITIRNGGTRWVQLVAAPSIPTARGGHLRYGVEIDGKPPMLEDLAADTSEKAWSDGVIAHARIGSTKVFLSSGRHRIAIRAIDPEIVAERLVVTPDLVDPLALDLPEQAIE
jgi:hypothetical protein